MNSGSRPLEWIGSSRKDLREFPRETRQVFGQALYVAQTGEKHADAKPLQGFGGASVLEVVDDHDGDTYRAVYTVRFAEAVYVLHCFQKKSKSGKATPKREMEKVESRLKLAEERHRQWLDENTTKNR